jgi:hypothetical protein
MKSMKLMNRMKPLKPLFMFIAAAWLSAAAFPAFSQADRPEWIRKPPKDTAAELYFCGESEEYNSLAEARDNATQNAIKQISAYMYTYISSSAKDFVRESGITGSTVSAELSESETKTFSEMVVSNVKSIAEYSERPRGKYKVWLLCVISPQEMEAQKARFEKELSESYTNQFLLIKNSAKNFIELLSGYETLYRGINPLKQSIVKFNNPEGGAVNFFDHLENEIKNLIGGISFEPAPPQTAQKGEALSISPRVRSTSILAVGGLRCRVTLMRGNTPLMIHEYTVANDNTVPVRVETDKLDDGKYNIRLELLLSEVTRNSKRNPDISFPFEVTPLNTIRVILLDDNAKNIAPKIRDILQKQGLLLVESNGAYRARIQVTLNERQTGNYFIVEPTLTITIELERDGTPLVTYTKNYGEFRHVSRAEAGQRAYRNMENDLAGNFAAQLREMGK